jgi:MoaA/NifB/PqqE/SkfB family radical SAM enzyme
MRTLDLKIKSEIVTDELSSDISTIISSPMIHGFRFRLIRLGIAATIFRLGMQTYRNPFIAFKVLKKIIQKRKKIHGNFIVPRFVKSGNLYHWLPDSPGWPSQAFDKFIQDEFIRTLPVNSTKKSMQTIFFAITNRCPLNCEHCFESKNIDSKDHLSLTELKIILEKIQDEGIHHIQLSGGEPLVRFNDMIELIKSAKPGTEFWLLTSGFGLTYEKAVQLKQAGLTGAFISLDHCNEKSHNDFRNNINAFSWVGDATINCRRAGIVVSLSLCLTRDFITEENLWNYLKHAKELGAGFIRILEPKNVGSYTGKDIQLSPSQIEMVEKFYAEINSNPKYGDLPILSYPGYHHRRVGCFGAGNRYLYIDSIGDFHPCPFCHEKKGNVLTTSFKNAIQMMKDTGCHEYSINHTD